MSTYLSIFRDPQVLRRRGLHDKQDEGDGDHTNHPRPHPEHTLRFVEQFHVLI